MSLLGEGWLSEEERNIVIGQIERVNVVENYLSLFKDDANVMSNMVLYMSETDFVANVLVSKRRFRTLMRNYKTVSETTLFSNFFNPLATEVQFIPGKNLIFIPLPVMHRFVNVFPLEDLQNYEIFSQLGYQLGQALFRPVEPKKLKSLMTYNGSAENEILTEFEDYLWRTAPIRKFDDGKLFLDVGSLNISMESRFADDGSLRLTMETYKKILFDDLPFLNVGDAVAKTYFLSVAQQFCAENIPTHEKAIDLYTKKDLPNSLRVNSMIMNSEAFKDTFQCPRGSTMNPALKLKQFPFIEDTFFGG